MNLKAEERDPRFGVQRYSRNGSTYKQFQGGISTIPTFEEVQIMKASRERRALRKSKGGGGTNEDFGRPLDGKEVIVIDDDDDDNDDDVVTGVDDSGKGKKRILRPLIEEDWEVKSSMNEVRTYHDAALIEFERGEKEKEEEARKMIGIQATFGSGSDSNLTVTSSSPGGERARTSVYQEARARSDEVLRRSSRSPEPYAEVTREGGRKEDSVLQHEHFRKSKKRPLECERDDDQGLGYGMTGSPSYCSRIARNWTIEEDEIIVDQ
ncbi:hypothetical protein IE53DRAFT_381880 [Violaceomyces palustris]|uniref:Uncharacterized protein n=1 Tax=Violaceomyces palustris TaxID=1673888 RepID=A0ACD0NPP6_9BASI|nr:hypothetical protein IE53DRAFT_381880 [Violaceomyces palustris]